MDTQELASSFALDPQQFIGIPLALIGAVFLSIGTQLQHRGVGHVDENSTNNARHGLNLGQLASLLARPIWLLGTLTLGLAIVMQLASLYFSPLIVVQPLGVLALVITTILNSRLAGVKLNHQTVVGVMMSVGGVFLFVTVAAFTATTNEVTDRQLYVILAILATTLVLLAVGFVLWRKRLGALYYVIGAGVLYGFVATLAKVVLGRIEQGEMDLLTWACVASLIAAAALGAYFVQVAYASGPPDLVVAGLTVVDPLVAVLIGIIVLGEASSAPLWASAVFLVAGVVAILGVLRIARHHPQLS